MQLFIKQRVFSWGAKFDIYGVDGKPVYYCEGPVFTIGKKLRIFNMNGTELVYIEQQLFRFMPRYDIYINGVSAATIVRKFTLFSHNYYFDGVDWTIEGDFFAHSYRVLSGGKVIMSIEKRWLSWGDTYELNIDPQHNPLLCLAAAIVIDCVCHDGSKHH